MKDFEIRTQLFYAKMAGICATGTALSAVMFVIGVLCVNVTLMKMIYAALALVIAGVLNAIMVFVIEAVCCRFASSYHTKIKKDY